MTRIHTRTVLVVWLVLLLAGLAAMALPTDMAAQPPRPTLTATPTVTPTPLPTAVPTPEPPPVVPEPSTLVLMGSALAGMGSYIALQARARRRG
ncbi:MAG TPA: PEP-CTERM sorting domain-containing protein [Anaerolineae bacterium]|jgi:hypothetical protein|nr:PEP-CTERM sorting domain-containing protein [Anaerolineae bacterium]